MSMSNSSAVTSAFLGQPPNNIDDYNIVRGIFRYYGLYTANASLGFVPAYATPAEFTHNSKQPAIIAGMAIVILVIVASTAIRVSLRAFKPALDFGCDDWSVLLASVKPPKPLRKYSVCGQATDRENLLSQHVNHIYSA